MKNKAINCIISALIVTSTWFFFVWQSYAQTITASRPYVINSITVPWIETTYPTRAKPNLDESITNLDYRIQTLPYDQDKSAAWYVVYPKAWVTIPLVRPDSNDLEKIKVGELFNHYKYLEEWALHYVWNAPDQGIGNMVLAVHSSFAKNDPWRYKTAGQVAPLSTIGDKVFVYLADTNGQYTLYIYTIKRSEEIPETAVDILQQNVTTKSLTLFTCYPIGTTDARRVNQAELTATLSEKEWSTNWWNTEETHQVAPEKNIVTAQKNTTTNKTAPTTKKSTTFKTQSQKISKSPSIKPTFKERVLFRPAVYNTSMKLIKTVWFKRANLQKVLDLIDVKIVWFEKVLETDVNAKKRIVLFMLIKEFIEGFMR